MIIKLAKNKKMKLNRLTKRKSACQISSKKEKSTMKHLKKKTGKLNEMNNTTQIHVFEKPKSLKLIIFDLT